MAKFPKTDIRHKYPSTKSSIAAAYGMDWRTVYKILKENGLSIPLNSNVITPNRWRRVCEILGHPIK